MKDWLKKRRERLEREAYNNGYDWAAGVLLRGDMSSDEVDGHIFYCSPISSTVTSTAFDRGASDALSKLVSLKAVEEPVAL